MIKLGEMIDFEFGVWFYCSVLAASIPILIPALQFGVIFRIWDRYNKPVNREYCQCSCWDTVFKAGYETGIGSYKHIYFNATQQTLIIWAFTVMSLVALYESVRKVFIALYDGSARPRMCILFLSVLYPHYYAWWAYFNYYNDDYYKQVWHQLFFTITEMASTIIVVHLVDKANVVTPRKILVIISIAILHILASGWDQFVENVIRQEGQLHQVMRDLGFMIPDIIHIVLPWQELREMSRRRGVAPSHLINDRDFVTAVVAILGLWMVCAMLQY